MLKILLGVYIASIIISSGSITLHELAYIERKKRLGYVNVEKKGVLEFLASFLPDLLITSIVVLIPLINVILSLMILCEFEKNATEEIKKELEDGKIEKIQKLENNAITQKEYLAKRIEEVKQFQGQLGYRNKITSISEYSIDEKIAILLRELELLYEEKARLEGINLDDEINFAKDEEIKLVLEKR